MTVTDTYQRPIISLRISITNRCNVNCFYCHHDGILPQKYEMTPDEIHRIAQVARGIGVRKIRLSGGTDRQLRQINERVPFEAADQSVLFGEALPAGLRLLAE